jgi:ribosomal protein S15
VAARKQRQDELVRLRDGSVGDPVRGSTTPFILSFDSAGHADASSSAQNSADSLGGQAVQFVSSADILNHKMTRKDLDDAIEHAYSLTKPIPPSESGITDAHIDAAELQAHEEGHVRASDALARLMTLENAGAKARLRANVRRIIETFGRHNTDHTVERAQRPLAVTTEVVPKPMRGGPDTGSSEVQIGILTAKIRALLNARETQPHSQHDKINKRNLRLLVHRRQKLLKYMERKERGSGRWVHMVEQLGLTPATWKKEISL